MRRILAKAAAMPRSAVAGLTASRRAERTGRRAWRWAGVLLALALLVLPAGCAPTVYNLNMRYQPTQVIAPVITDGRKFSLTVAAFSDRRKIDDTLLIGRVIQSDGSWIPVLPRYVKAPDAVAAALREVLGKTGYSVSPEKASWDLDEKTIRPDWGRILVGGAIEELFVTCVERIPQKHYTATARITLVFADVEKKRIFYRITSESSSTLDHLFFSEEKLEGQINGVLSEAIEKAATGTETARQIRAALKE